MKLDVEIRFLVNYSAFNAGETESFTVDCDYIDDHDDLVNAIAEELDLREDEFEIVNEEQFWNDISDSSAASSVKFAVGDIVRNKDLIYEIVSHNEENNTYTLKLGSFLYNDIDVDTISKMEVFKKVI